MHYYIDGYNLLFRQNDSHDDLASSRQLIIKDLNNKAAQLDLQLTLVFDAQYQLGESTRSHYKHIQILFSAYGETADDLILSEIRFRGTPQNITVVTSDKKLAWFARRCSAKTESIGHFTSWINRRLKNKIRRDQEEKTSIPSIPKEKKPSKSSPRDANQYYLEKFEEKYKELEKNKKRQK